jgi:hypothetical protein
MPSNVKISSAARNSRIGSLNTSIGASALIRLYDGTQPAGPGTAITTQVLLAEWTGNAGGFGTATGGVLTASAVASVTAVASGTAAWFRILTSGAVAVIDGSAGVAASTPDMVLSNATIGSGNTATFVSLTFTDGNA